MTQSAQEAVTKCSRLSGIEIAEVYQGSGGWKLNIKLLTWSASGNGPIQGCRLLSSCCVLTWKNEQKNCSPGLNKRYQFPFPQDLVTPPAPQDYTFNFYQLGVTTPTYKYWRKTAIQTVLYCEPNVYLINSIFAYVFIICACGIYTYPSPPKKNA